MKLYNIEIENIRGSKSKYTNDKKSINHILNDFTILRGDKFYIDGKFLFECVREDGFRTLLTVKVKGGTILTYNHITLMDENKKELLYYKKDNGKYYKARTGFYSKFEI